MAKVIETNFDGTLQDDVSFEQTSQLKNTVEMVGEVENIYKTYLYLKKMFNQSAKVNQIKAIKLYENIDEDTAIEIVDDVNLITIKNIEDDKAEIVYNDNDVLKLMSFEQIDLPCFEGDTFTIKSGSINVIEIKLEVR